MNQFTRLIACILCLLTLTIPAVSQTPSLPVGSDYTWVEVVSGFDNPLLVTHAGDGSGRLFVGEQTGFILIVQNGEYLFDPFLDISRLLSNDVFQGGYSERGLLGLAFHPDYANNGYFFVSHTDAQGDNRIARYQVSPDDPNRADPASRTEFLHIPQPHHDHNGGNIAFDASGYLYIGIGDGGSLGDDPGVYAQDLNSPLGKLLRIDVNTPDGSRPYSIPPDNPFISTDGALPEIWAVGLRNPWRFSFDRLTGDLYTGDVGQQQFEEINFQPAGAPGGANYGWYWYEARRLHRTLPPITPQLTMPIAEYPHMVGCAVMGGYVYRGTALPELNGVYFFGDYCTGRTWSLFRDDTGTWRVQPFIHTGHIISAFGEDEAGELYLVDYKGAVLRLERAS